jgi:hypothetical protein
MIMNIAVAQGAAGNQTFFSYVEYLAANGFVPPNGNAWVDYIRKRSNEANHEIALMNEKDSRTLIVFVEALLRYIYELPAMVPAVED